MVIIYALNKVKFPDYHKTMGDELFKESTSPAAKGCCCKCHLLFHMQNQKYSR